MLRKFGLIVLLALIVIQFFHPAKNQSTELLNSDITKVMPVSDEVLNLLKTSCYDCHSNSTNYPWYSSIQPIAWWLSRHVNEGKKHLNFSEFGLYNTKKARHKLDETVEVLEENEMPLKSYTIIHQDAKLTAEQKAVIVKWAKQSKANYTANTYE